MKGTKTSLFLVELIISLLLFAFCAAICIQLFHAASERTRKSEALSKGVFAATQAAELYKASGGDINAISGAYSIDRATLVDGNVTLYFNSSWQSCTPPGLDSASTTTAMYSLAIADLGDGRASINVYDLKGTDWASYSALSAYEPFFSIDVKAVA